MFVIGFTITAFSLPLAICMTILLFSVDEHPYIHRLLFGLSEGNAVMITIILFGLAIIGILLMVFGWMSRRNKAALDSIVNAEKQNYCSHCNINVSDQLMNCPVCGRALKNKGE